MVRVSFNEYCKDIGSEGQSTVEYILLLVVVMSISLSVYNSRSFKDFFGEDSTFFDRIARDFEVGYQYGQLEIKNPVPNYGGNHEGFYNPDENSSRFWIAEGVYGQ